jgi:hypothetical protein
MSNINLLIHEAVHEKICEISSLTVEQSVADHYSTATELYKHGFYSYMNYKEGGLYFVNRDNKVYKVKLGPKKVSKSESLEEISFDNNFIKIEANNKLKNQLYEFTRVLGFSSLDDVMDKILSIYIIGYPINDVSLYIMNEENELVPALFLE